MADLTFSEHNKPVISSSLYSEDSFEDACSICLEPFNTSDPSTVTNCKHEYHLQCILEWSQRSSNCPICSQSLVLKDTASQELLVAVESERITRAKRQSPSPTILHQFNEDSDIEHDDSYSDDSDFDERIMHHLAAAASRARFIHRRARQRSSGLVHAPVFPYASSTNGQNHPPSEGCPNLNYGCSEDNSPSSTLPPAMDVQSPREPPVARMLFSTNVPFKPRACESPPDSPQQANQSDISFSETIKSKFSAASSRCKESFAKSTKGFKEKLLVRNNEVKEMSKGVQREMNAGFARMFERLELKRTGSSPSDPGSAVGSSNFSFKGKGLQDDADSMSLNQDKGKGIHNLTADAPSLISCTRPAELEVSHAQSSS